MLLTHLVLFSFLAGASASDAPPVAAEAHSGGWFRKAKPRFRQETETDRDARIKADRVLMGILPPEPSEFDAGDIPSINSDTTGDTKESVRSSTYSLAAHLLPEDLAGLEALAARAAELTIDAEIALWLKLDQQRRLHDAWLRDEDDAAVLLLAIATIH